MKVVILFILVVFLSYCIAGAVKEETIEVVEDKKDEKKDVKGDDKASRQLEYISLLNTLLRQTNVLGSFDGVLLAFTTALAAIVSKFKPLLMASALSYFLFVAAALFMPATVSQLGLPTMNTPNPQFAARSMDSGMKMFDNPLADTVVRSIQISPVMNVITNVSVNVVSDTMSRFRMMSRMMTQQLSLVQGNMVWFGRALSNECVTKFMCRVGQYTVINFPMAATFLRTMADSYPGMDEFAVAVVRGTSSSNCSLIYPDCTI